MRPCISVIIPAFNAEKTVERAVRSALAQSWENIEVVVIDDASADATANIAGELAGQDGRVRVLRNAANIGVAASRNRGFDEARGEFVALLDADDAWLPEKLEKQMALIGATGCDLCYTAYAFIDIDGRPLQRAYAVPEEVTLKSMLYENAVGASSALFRAEIAKTLRMRGDYAHEDYVLWLEMLQSGCTARGVNAPLTLYCVSDAGRSGNKLRSARARWRVHRAFLGFSRWRAFRYFCVYAVRGLKKHRLGSLIK